MIVGSLSPGQNLKKIRTKHKMTQEVISEVLKVSKSYYSKLEGDFKPPSYRFLYEVKKKFKGTDMNKFFY